MSITSLPPSSIAGDTGRVRAVREFNRTYTNALGLLRGKYLDSPYSLTEARVLFELAHRDISEVTVLRRSLDIDAGYLSRILARFETDGLVTRTRSANDGRRRVIQLTAHGLAAFGQLDTRSTERISALLSRLSDTEQARLTSAMDAIAQLLEGPARPAAFVLRAPRTGDLGWVVQRNGELYAREYGWDASYEALVARIVADYAGRDDAREAAWIAEVDGEPAGCVFCMRKTDTTAQLRLLLVEPHARGLGLGGRLVSECVTFARGHGYADIVLWTNDVLAAARQIYQRTGFELVDSAPHRSFGHDLVGQNWRLALA
ncbi:MAG TPA: helix-turn-helix domain-containing GNAT family N-acetyltransferase [Streptosporangiaceae bacterium]|nr:helix-turn-helix domain-containing GNAT family N-acetyltransferase [Streptosporangiaceae bacterium]